MNETKNFDLRSQLFQKMKQEFPELDETLYSPSISKASQLDPKRRVYNPHSFYYLGFFIAAYMIFPVLFNYYQFRRWRSLITGFLLFSLAMTASILLSYSIAQMYMVEFKLVARYVMRILFLLLGIVFYVHQKRDYRWFLFADGVPLSAFFIGFIFMLISIFLPIVNAIFIAPYAIFAQILIKLFM